MYDDDFAKRIWRGRIVKVCVWLAVFAAVGCWYAQHERPVTARQRLAIVRDTTQPASARYISADQLQYADAGIVPELMEELRSGDALGRELAALALGRLHSKAADAIDLLVQTANDDEVSVRKQAMIALGRIDAQRKAVLAALRKGAQDDDSSIRDEAFAALGRSYPEGGNELVSLLAADDADVRRRAAIELGRMEFDTDVAKDALRTLLAESDSRTRAEAYAALFRLSAIDAGSLARGMMDDADPLVRRTASRLFLKHPDKTEEVLIRAVNQGKPDVQFALLEQLIITGETDIAVPRLAEMLESDDKETVRRAAGLIAYAGPPARHTAARLLAHLDDPEERVHHDIWIALNNVGFESRLRPPELFDALHSDGDTAVSFVHWGPSRLFGARQEDPRDYALTDADIEHLKKLKRLRYLFLARNPVGDAGLAQLAELKELEWLDLTDTDITSSGLRHLVGLSNLRELDIGYCAISDDGLKYLADFPALERLSLCGMRLTDRGMVNLADLQHLKSLDLRYIQVTDDGLAHLKRLTTLEEISLPERVTLHGAAQLSGLTKIKKVWQPVTDSDLQSLQSLSHLREIDLRSTSITDAGLVYLKELPNLRRLSLSGARVTQRGVDELKGALPDLVVWPFSAAAASMPVPNYQVVGADSLSIAVQQSAIQNSVDTKTPFD